MLFTRNLPITNAIFFLSLFRINSSMYSIHLFDNLTVYITPAGDTGAYGLRIKQILSERVGDTKNEAQVEYSNSITPLVTFKYQQHRGLNRKRSPGNDHLLENFTNFCKLTFRSFALIRVRMTLFLYAPCNYAGS